MGDRPESKKIIIQSEKGIAYLKHWIRRTLPREQIPNFIIKRKDRFEDSGAIEIHLYIDEEPLKIIRCNDDIFADQAENVLRDAERLF